MSKAFKPLLLQAAELVSIAMSELNLDSHVCEGCQREKFDAWPEAQMHKELTALRTKLLRFANGDLAK